MSTVPTDSARARGRSCLVTGARGFLGQHIVQRLIAAGVRVTVLDRHAAAAGSSRLDSLTADLTEPGWSQALRNAWRWDDVIHLAGPVSKGSPGFVEDAQVARAHVQIALALALALPSGWNGRLIHASSMVVYGAAPHLPVHESQALAPRFPYALGKVLAEDVWRSTTLDDVWLLRLPGLFAPSRQWGALFHFIRAGLEGRPIRLTATEPTLWDILHVEDAAEAVTRALSCPLPFRGAMNVSYGEVVELEAVARRISELTRQVEVINETRVAHPPFQLDIGEARARIAWPPCSLDQRLEELVRAVEATRG
jgi:nucleoside-diphosphate-sugar epimerase